MVSLGKGALIVLTMATFAAGFAAHALFTPPTVEAAAANRVFEIRTYTAAPGKLDALKARFRDNTIRIFNKHHMTSVGYWVPEDAPRSQDTLIYILAHPSRDAATKNWDAFRNDPEWIKVKADSEKDGPLTTKTESVFADSLDFSPLK